MARPSASRVRPSGGGEPPRNVSEESSRGRVFIVERPKDGSADDEKDALALTRKRLRRLASLLSVLSCW